VLLYIDWLAKQLLPDTAEQEWLDRHGNIWLRNADGSIGRKLATFASGTVRVYGTINTVVPPFAVLRSAASGVSYQTTEQGIVGPDGTGEIAAEALTPGAVGNLERDDILAFVDIVDGVEGQASAVIMSSGIEEENDDQLRERVLFRIQKPPMGGDAEDYIRWALEVPGVTRAWSYPNEMGIGTVAVRFLMDELRANNHGIPNDDDILTVKCHLDKMRPVAVKNFFVVAPIPLFYDITITGLEKDDEAVRVRIEAAIKKMELRRAAPGQTMYRSWVDEAISGALGEDHHELVFGTTPMPDVGHIPVLGTIYYA
jgi:uncharacterized phage protein gp47/JayE